MPMTEITTPNGDDDIRYRLQDELIERTLVLMRRTRSASVRLQVPRTDIQIIAGPESWLRSQICDQAHALVTAVPPADVIAGAVAAMIDHMADNWPMKKYSLEDIEVRLRAEAPAIAVLAKGAAPTAAQAAGRSVADDQLWMGELENLPGYEAPLVYGKYSVKDYHLAPSGEGPRAYDWSDKPHRLVYDLCRALLAANNAASHAPDATLAASRDAEPAHLARQAQAEPVDQGHVLRTLRQMLDGSQPKDVPGAVAVIDNALKAGIAWSYDIAPPEGFVSYVKANYTGDVHFHDPEWHATRLWNAAMKNVGARIAAPVAPAGAQNALPQLTVWEGAMPESNGKSNFTAALTRKGAQGFDVFEDGFTIARSEYPDRARYEADCVRYLIGELAEKPWITDYDADKHSGYVKPAAGAQNAEAIRNQAHPELTPMFLLNAALCIEEEHSVPQHKKDAIVEKLGRIAEELQSLQTGSANTQEGGE